jgi:glutaminyl-tRNA synthetase
MYDFAHPLSDAIERITHSLCTLEFENNRDIYDWLVDTLPFPDPPRQTEFARLNLTYTLMSKRKLAELVERKLVAGWDDPRLPTLAGLRRRGFTPAALRDFCERIGVAKSNSTVDVALLEHCQRENLNPQVPRVLAVLRPLKVVIENYPETQVEELEAPLYPHDVPKEGTRKVPFSRHLYIEQDDFAENPPKGFHRLTPGREVRLRYAYLVRCESVVKDPASGEIVEVRCTYDPATLGGAAPDGRKVPGTLHWVSAAHSVPVEVRLYDRLFRVERPDLEEGGFESCLNPHSLEVLAGSRIEPAAVDPAMGERLQFERQGYFFRDPVDSTPDHPVFNRIVPLRDSWALEVQKQTPAAAPATTSARERKPKPPKETEAKVPDPLSAEELELLDQLRPEVSPLVESVLAAHPNQVELYRKGKTGLLGFLIAQVMKQVAEGGGKASPKLISVMVTERLGLP